MKLTQLLILSIITLSLSVNGNADDWHLRTFFGKSTMSDFTAEGLGFEQTDVSSKINLGGGFNAGLGLGYQVHKNWVLEFAWEYRSNDSAVEFAGGDRYDDGNYASNIFFLNGIHLFDNYLSWQPYVGFGVGWVQEIDIDLERPGEELSYSGDGDIGPQLFAGVSYKLNDWLELQGELRYGSFTDISLSSEVGDSQTFNAMDYKPATFQLGVSFSY